MWYDVQANPERFTILIHDDDQDNLVGFPSMDTTTQFWKAYWKVSIEPTPLPDNFNATKQCAFKLGFIGSDKKVKKQLLDLAAEQFGQDIDCGTWHRKKRH